MDLTVSWSLACIVRTIRVCVVLSFLNNHSISHKKELRMTTSKSSRWKTSSIVISFPVRGNPARCVFLTAPRGHWATGRDVGHTLIPEAFEAYSRQTSERVCPLDGLPALEAGTGAGTEIGREPGWVGFARSRFAGCCGVFPSPAVF